MGTYVIYARKSTESEDKQILSIDSQVAELERLAARHAVPIAEILATKFIDDLRQNVKRGNRARFERGWPNFPPPLGYMNDRLAKTIVRDPERFDPMRRMWDLLLMGSMSPKAIAMVANREWGFRTRVRAHQGGGPLSYSTLYDSFKNPYYMGIIRLSDGREYLGKHEPMVTKAEFEQAQRVLSIRSRPRASKHAFAFTGLMTCGHCGAAITAEQHFKGDRRYVYYHCCRSKIERPCTEQAVREESLVEQFAEILGSLRMPPAIHAEVLARMDALEADNTRMAASKRIELLAAIRDCEQQRDALLGVRVSLLISDEEFLRKRANLDQRKQELEGELRRLDELGIAAKLARARQMTDLAQTAREAFLAGSDKERKALLHEVAQEMTLQNGRVRFRAVAPIEALRENRLP